MNSPHNIQSEIESLVARIFQAGYKSGKHKTGLQMVITSDVIEPAAVKELLALFTTELERIIGEDEHSDDDSDKPYAHTEYFNERLARNELRAEMRQALRAGDGIL